MTFDLKELPKILESSSISKIFRSSLNDLRSRLSKNPQKILDLEEFSKIFKLFLTSKIFKILDLSSIMKKVGSSLNDLWSRRSSDDLWMKFYLEDFPKILDWYLISKIFRRSLKDLRHGRSSLVALKILEKYLISNILWRSLNDLRS